MYYFYYRRLEDGSLRPGRIVADESVTVHEEERKDAKLQVWNWVTTDRSVWWFGIPHDDDGYSYDFYVPKGTVKTGFSM